ncbi:hypothetical protein CJ030_MR7G014275 [Morella rubra]|uniref:Uncharacterized protein n=1 Tax=Morella rubra TaxID=262757 RepID=A0A6A1V4F3_9ROSI|nr:hypothetical protein CJ030_MR7G014275 [Morella rubra]
MANPKRPASKKSKPTKKPSKKQAVNPDPDRFVDAHAHELMLGTYAKRKPLYEQRYYIFFLYSSFGSFCYYFGKILNAVGTIATNSTVHAVKLQKLEENYDRTCGALRRLRKAFVKLRRSIYIDREPSPSRSEESASSDANIDADDTDAYADSSTDDAGPSSAAS